MSATTFGEQELRRLVEQIKDEEVGPYFQIVFVVPGWIAPAMREKFPSAKVIEQDTVYTP